MPLDYSLVTIRRGAAIRCGYLGQPGGLVVKHLGQELTIESSAWRVHFRLVGREINGALVEDLLHHPSERASVGEVSGDFSMDTTVNTGKALRQPKGKRRRARRRMRS